MKSKKLLERNSGTKYNNRNKRIFSTFPTWTLLIAFGFVPNITIVNSTHKLFKLLKPIAKITGNLKLL